MDDSVCGTAYQRHLILLVASPLSDCKDTPTTPLRSASSVSFRDDRCQQPQDEVGFVDQRQHCSALRESLAMVMHQAHANLDGFRRPPDLRARLGRARAARSPIPNANGSYILQGEVALIRRPCTLLSRYSGSSSRYFVNSMPLGSNAAVHIRPSTDS